jgi:hypothetical protein
MELIMTPDDLKKIMSFLKSRVSIGGEKPDDPIKIDFDAPDLDTMTRAGLDSEGSKAILNADWWDDMLNDIIETPDFCESDDPPEQVLIYAKDVVEDYLRKRVEI